MIVSELGYVTDQNVKHAQLIISVGSGYSIDIAAKDCVRDGSNRFRVFEGTCERSATLTVLRKGVCTITDDESGRTGFVCWEELMFKEEAPE